MEGPILPISSNELTGYNSRHIPVVYIADIKAVVDELLSRSNKFSAFFSRAELEEHVAMALGKVKGACGDGGV